ncbi:hypothetical protein SISSUDRAFT_1120121 [Sistotremastrum suecicum HHB10207 ss-3]|uniref:Uncharacterized protein n=1 Tax=Sistotremastrum suecicum HHB10207 ss-3 TaxID=1314776 RepID=A0A166CPD5_9AGAM|nr:hypothetical protein SISSUDRAFT_1120121 [Sistotremastrum suecicum HHB10207 ss-3]
MPEPAQHVASSASLLTFASWSSTSLPDSFANNRHVPLQHFELSPSAASCRVSEAPGIFHTSTKHGAQVIGEDDERPTSVGIVFPPSPQSAEEALSTLSLPPQRPRITTGTQQDQRVSHTGPKQAASFQWTHGSILCRSTNLPSRWNFRFHQTFNYSWILKDGLSTLRIDPTARVGFTSSDSVSGWLLGPHVRRCVIAL